MDKPEDLINAMCLTWRHDFGLNAPEANKDGMISWTDGASIGMTDAQRQALRLQMRQLYEHHIKPAILSAQSQAYIDAARIAEEKSRSMARKIMRQNTRESEAEAAFHMHNALMANANYISAAILQRKEEIGRN